MADFEWFRSFVAIYRLGSVSTAARHRSMTQPALSQHLASLEAEIGERLFHRGPRQMIPTEKGKDLYNQVVKAVDRLEKVTGSFIHSPHPSVVRLGAPPEYFHERIAPRWNRTDLDLEVSLGVTRPLLDRLRKGELDLVIATQQIAASGLVYTKYVTESFVLVGDWSHKKRMENIVEEETAISVLESFRWLSYDMDLPIIRRFWFKTFHTRLGIRPNYVVPDLRTIKEMVKAGLGVSVLPDYLVASDLYSGALHELWSAPTKVTNDLWLVHRSSDLDEEIIKRVIESLISMNN